MNYVEKMIVQKLASAMIKAHGSIVVDSERGYDPEAPRFSSAAKAVKEADQFDEVHLFAGGSHKAGYDNHAYLIFGNGNGGWDVLSDYNMSLEPVIQPVMDFVEKNSN